MKCYFITSNNLHILFINSVPKVTSCTQNTYVAFFCTAEPSRIEVVSDMKMPSLYRIFVISIYLYTPILQRNNLYLLKYIRLVLFMFIILRYDCTLLFYNWPIACPHFSSISKIPYRGSVLDGSVTGGNLEWLLLGVHSLSRFRMTTRAKCIEACGHVPGTAQGYY